MDYFHLYNGAWHVEGVSLSDIHKVMGTPCYVYSRAALQSNWQSFDKAFNHYPHQINYAVKANSNIAVLNIFARLDSGFDIVSKGELERVLAAKGDPQKIIFSGVGKTSDELRMALESNVGCINIESEDELLRLDSIAQSLKKKANIAFRVNPDVDPKSHPYISTGLKENKFGVSTHDAIELYKKANHMEGIQIQGLAFHIGSQIASLTPFIEALDKILELLQVLKELHIPIFHVNVGGGLGVCYKNEKPPLPSEYVDTLITKLQNMNLKIYIEPGRAIAANSGVLLTKVEYIKKQNAADRYFAIVDAGMNDILRPALYGSWQDIVPVIPKPSDSPLFIYDIVGPICETADFLGKDRTLSLTPEDLLMVCSAGAYGFSMSSNYNSRPRAAEVMVDGDQFHVIREREVSTELYAREKILPLE